MLMRLGPVDSIIANKISRFQKSKMAAATIVKIGPVVLAENSLIDIALRGHVVVQRISSNISECTGPIFEIFSPYDLGSCRYVGKQLSRLKVSFEMVRFLSDAVVLLS